MMRDYRVWAGRPSFRKMAGTINNRYGPSTLSNPGGKKGTLPSLTLTLAYIEACAVDGDPTGDLEIWKEAWRRIALPSQPDCDAGPR
jgi:hypothetical protein